MFNYYDIKEKVRPEEILVYLRKSRADDPLLSVEEVLAKHEEILNEWAERNLGAAIPEGNKFREVVSGETIDDRPEVQKVLKLIESPKIKAILIVEVQRLSRGDLEDAGRLIKLIRYTNTLVITPMKTFDIKDEYDRDMFERELKRGNEFLEYQKKIMNRGRLLSVSQGHFIGSVPPYGYDKIFITEGKRKCPTLAINEEQANIVRMIFDMYVNKNMGVHVICHHLDELHIQPAKGKNWSPHAVREMLINVHYIGKVKWNWRKTVVVVEDGEVKKTNPKAKEGEYLVFEGKHPAIVSEELFQRAQEKKGRNPRSKPATKVRNPLAGLLYCRCGRAMSLKMYNTASGGERSSPRLICDGQVHCNTGSCLQSEVMDFVVSVLEKKIAEFEIKAKNTDDESAKVHAQLIKNLEKKLSNIDDREVSLWEAQADPDPANRMPQHIFQNIKAKLAAEREETERALEQARRNMPDPVDYAEKTVTLKNTLETLLDDNASAMEKNRLLKTCIGRIDYSREKPQRLKGSGVKGLWSDPPIELDIKLLV